MDLLKPHSIEPPYSGNFDQLNLSPESIWMRFLHPTALQEALQQMPLRVVIGQDVDDGCSPTNPVENRHHKVA